MCTTANIVALSLQRGVLLREGQHGDRVFVEHDGCIIINTMPNDIAVTIGEDNVGAAIVGWAKDNLKEFKYVNDFVSKKIVFKMADKYGNAIAAEVDSTTPIETMLDFIISDDVDNLSIRSNKRVCDYAKLVNEIDGLRKAIDAAKED